MQLDVRAIDIKLAEKGMTRTSLASSAGMCRQSVSTVLKRGTCNPVTAGKLAAALDVDISDIIPKKYPED